MLSRGAKRCLALLESYAARSGVAFPFQRTLAAKLEVDERTVRRYVRELVAAGIVGVTKRQHCSALYQIQTGQNVRSDVRSGVRSEPRYPYMSLKLSGSEIGVPVIQRKPQTQPVGNFSIPLETEVEAWEEPQSEVVARIRARMERAS